MASNVRKIFYVIYDSNRLFYYLLMGLVVSLLPSCASYTENGELVRHHFGYVKVVTPAAHAPDSSIKLLEVETYGVWINIDSRSAGEDKRGYGGGLGYQYDRRDQIPLDCRIVVRVNTQNELNEFMETIKNSKNKEEGICVVRDSVKQ